MSWVDVAVTAALKAFLITIALLSSACVVVAIEFNSAILCEILLDRSKHEFVS